MRRKTRRSKTTILSNGKHTTRGRSGILNGLTKTLISTAALNKGKKKAKKMYVVVSDNIKEHPYRSLGYITLGMGIISTLFLLQRHHWHS